MSDQPSDTRSAPLDQLEKRVQSDLNVIRRDLKGRLSPIEAALEAYRRAVEERGALAYAASHSLTKPSSAGLTPLRAAENLLIAVRRLPELADEARAEDTNAQQSSAPAAPPPEPSDQPPSAQVAVVDEPSENKPMVRPLSDALPRIAAAAEQQKLVIVGALAGRRKPLPAPLDKATEWVDTGSGGAHATLSIPTRLRRGSIFAVVLCDQAISHKHAEPIVDAARSAKIPVGFAGKGGAAGIARALEAIEDQLD